MAKPIVDFKDSKKILLLVFGLLAASVVGVLFMNSGGYSDGLFPEEEYDKPDQVLEKDIDYKILLKTSFGDITIDLFEEETPITVNNILFLIGEGYYEGVTFHRVVKDFVIQAGDPTGDGTGGPGYSIDDEITGRKYASYSVGMANSGPDTNGSQFFIVSGNVSDSNLGALDGKYTLFGKVVEGFSVVDSIERVSVNNNDKPINDVVIEAIQIWEN